MEFSLDEDYAINYWPYEISLYSGRPSSDSLGLDYVPLK
jgi:hypothetical protein